MMRTPGADSRMFQTPGRPDGAAYPGSMQTTKRPGSVTFQFPESTGRTFRQGMGTNVSLSTWGSDFSPTGYTPYSATAHGPTPAQVSSGTWSIRGIVLGVTRLIGVELKKRLFDEQQK